MALEEFDNPSDASSSDSGGVNDVDNKRLLASVGAPPPGLPVIGDDTSNQGATSPSPSMPSFSFSGPTEFDNSADTNDAAPPTPVRSQPAQDLWSQLGGGIQRAENWLAKDVTPALNPMNHLDLVGDIAKATPLGPTLGVLTPGFSPPQLPDWTRQDDPQRLAMEKWMNQWGPETNDQHQHLGMIGSFFTSVTANMADNYVKPLLDGIDQALNNVQQNPDWWSNAENVINWAGDRLNAPRYQGGDALNYLNPALPIGRLLDSDAAAQFAKAVQYEFDTNRLKSSLYRVANEIEPNGPSETDRAIIEILAPVVSTVAQFMPILNVPAGLAFATSVKQTINQNGLEGLKDLMLQPVMGSEEQGGILALAQKWQRAMNGQGPMLTATDVGNLVSNLFMSAMMIHGGIEGTKTGVGAARAGINKVRSRGQGVGDVQSQVSNEAGGAEAAGAGSETGQAGQTGEASPVSKAVIHDAQRADDLGRPEGERALVGAGSEEAGASAPESNVPGEAPQSADGQRNELQQSVQERLSQLAEQRQRLVNMEENPPFGQSRGQVIADLDARMNLLQQEGRHYPESPSRMTLGEDIPVTTEAADRNRPELSQGEFQDLEHPGGFNSNFTPPSAMAGELPQNTGREKAALVRSMLEAQDLAEHPTSSDWLKRDGETNATTVDEYVSQTRDNALAKLEGAANVYGDVQQIAHGTNLVGGPDNVRGAGQVRSEDPSTIIIDPEAMPHPDQVQTAVANMMNILATYRRLPAEVREAATRYAQKMATATYQDFYNFTAIHEAVHVNLLRMFGIKPDATWSELGAALMEDAGLQQWRNVARRAGLKNQLDILDAVHAKADTEQEITPEEVAAHDLAASQLFEHLTYQIMPMLGSDLHDFSLATVQTFIRSIYDRPTHEAGTSAAQSWFQANRNRTARISDVPSLTADGRPVEAPVAVPDSAPDRIGDAEAAHSQRVERITELQTQLHSVQRQLQAATGGRKQKLQGKLRDLQDALSSAIAPEQRATGVRTPLDQPTEGEPIGVQGSRREGVGGSITRGAKGAISLDRNTGVLAPRFVEPETPRERRALLVGELKAATDERDRVAAEHLRRLSIINQDTGSRRQPTAYRELVRIADKNLNDGLLKWESENSGLEPGDYKQQRSIEKERLQDLRDDYLARKVEEAVGSHRADAVAPAIQEVEKELADLNRRVATAQKALDWHDITQKAKELEPATRPDVDPLKVRRYDAVRVKANGPFQGLLLTVQDHYWSPRTVQEVLRDQKDYGKPPTRPDVTGKTPEESEALLAKYQKDNQDYLDLVKARTGTVKWISAYDANGNPFSFRSNELEPVERAKVKPDLAPWHPQNAKYNQVKNWDAAVRRGQIYDVPSAGAASVDPLVNGTQKAVVTSAEGVAVARAKMKRDLADNVIPVPKNDPMAPERFLIYRKGEEASLRGVLDALTKPGPQGDWEYLRATGAKPDDLIASLSNRYGGREGVRVAAVRDANRVKAPAKAQINGYYMPSIKHLSDAVEASQQVLGAEGWLTPGDLIQDMQDYVRLERDGLRNPTGATGTAGGASINAPGVEEKGVFDPATGMTNAQRVAQIDRRMALVRSLWQDENGMNSAYERIFMPLQEKAKLEMASGRMGVLTSRSLIFRQLRDRASISRYKTAKGITDLLHDLAIRNDEIDAFEKSGDAKARAELIARRAAANDTFLKLDPSIQQSLTSIGFNRNIWGDETQVDPELKTSASSRAVVKGSPRTSPAEILNDFFKAIKADGGIGGVLGGRLKPAYEKRVALNPDGSIKLGANGSPVFVNVVGPDGKPVISRNPRGLSQIQARLMHLRAQGIPTQLIEDALRNLQNRGVSPTLASDAVNQLKNTGLVAHSEALKETFTAIAKGEEKRLDTEKLISKIRKDGGNADAIDRIVALFRMKHELKVGDDSWVDERERYIDHVIDQTPLDIEWPYFRAADDSPRDYLSIKDVQAKVKELEAQEDLLDKTEKKQKLDASQKTTLAGLKEHLEELRAAVKKSRQEGYLVENPETGKKGEADYGWRDQETFKNHQLLVERMARQEAKIAEHPLEVARKEIDTRRLRNLRMAGTTEAKLRTGESVGESAAKVSSRDMDRMSHADLYHHLMDKAMGSLLDAFKETSNAFHEGRQPRSFMDVYFDGPTDLSIAASKGYQYKSFNDEANPDPSVLHDAASQKIMRTRLEEISQKLADKKTFGANKNRLLKEQEAIQKFIDRLHLVDDLKRGASTAPMSMMPPKLQDMVEGPRRSAMQRTRDKKLAERAAEKASKGEALNMREARAAARAAGRVSPKETLQDVPEEPADLKVPDHLAKQLNRIRDFYPGLSDEEVLQAEMTGHLFELSELGLRDLDHAQSIYQFSAKSDDTQNVFHAWVDGSAAEGAKTLSMQTRVGGQSIVLDGASLDADIKADAGKLRGFQREAKAQGKTLDDVLQANGYSHVLNFDGQKSASQKLYVADESHMIRGTTPGGLRRRMSDALKETLSGVAQKGMSLEQHAPIEMTASQLKKAKKLVNAAIDTVVKQTGKKVTPEQRAAIHAAVLERGLMPDERLGEGDMPARDDEPTKLVDQGNPAAVKAAQARMDQAVQAAKRRARTTMQRREEMTEFNDLVADGAVPQEIVDPKALEALIREALAPQEAPAPAQGGGKGGSGRGGKGKGEQPSESSPAGSSAFTPSYSTHFPDQPDRAVQGGPSGLYDLTSQRDVNFIHDMTYEKKTVKGESVVTTRARTLFDQPYDDAREALRGMGGAHQAYAEARSALVERLTGILHANNAITPEAEMKAYIGNRKLAETLSRDSGEAYRKLVPDESVRRRIDDAIEMENEPLDKVGERISDLPADLQKIARYRDEHAKVVGKLLVELGIADEAVSHYVKHIFKSDASGRSWNPFKRDAEYFSSRGNMNAFTSRVKDNGQIRFKTRKAAEEAGIKVERDVLVNDSLADLSVIRAVTAMQHRMMMEEALAYGKNGRAVRFIINKGDDWKGSEYRPIDVPGYENRLVIHDKNGELGHSLADLLEQEYYRPHGGDTLGDQLARWYLNYVNKARAIKLTLSSVHISNLQTKALAYGGFRALVGPLAAERWKSYWNEPHSMTERAKALSNGMFGLGYVGAGDYIRANMRDLYHEMILSGLNLPTHLSDTVENLQPLFKGHGLGSKILNSGHDYIFNYIRPNMAIGMMYDEMERQFAEHPEWRASGADRAKVMRTAAEMTNTFTGAPMKMVLSKSYQSIAPMVLFSPHWTLSQWLVGKRALMPGDHGEMANHLGSVYRRTLMMGLVYLTLAKLAWVGWRAFQNSQQNPNQGMEQDIAQAMSEQLDAFFQDPSRVFDFVTGQDHQTGKYGESTSRYSYLHNPFFGFVREMADPIIEGLVKGGQEWQRETSPNAYGEPQKGYGSALQGALGAGSQAMWSRFFNKVQSAGFVPFDAAFDMEFERGFSGHGFVNITKDPQLEANYQALRQGLFSWLPQDGGPGGMYKRLGYALGRLRPGPLEPTVTDPTGLARDPVIAALKAHGMPTDTYIALKQMGIDPIGFGQNGLGAQWMSGSWVVNTPFGKMTQQQLDDLAANKHEVVRKAYQAWDQAGKDPAAQASALALLDRLGVTPSEMRSYMEKQIGPTKGHSVNSADSAFDRLDAQTRAILGGGVGPTGADFERLHNHTITADQAKDYHDTYMRQLGQTRAWMASQPQFKSLNPEDRLDYTKQNLTLMKTLVEKQMAIKYGYEKGEPISDAQVKNILADTFTYEAQIMPQLHTQDFYTQADPEQQRLMDEQTRSLVVKAHEDAYTGKLRGLTTENLDLYIKGSIAVDAFTRDQLKQNVSDWETMSVADQDSTMKHYVDLAHKYMEDAVVGHVEKQIGGRLQAGDVFDLMSQTIAMEERAKDRLTISPWFMSLDATKQDSTLKEYSNLAQQIALMQMGQDLGFSHHIPVQFQGDPEGVLEARFTSDEAYYHLQDQFGGNQIIDELDKQLNDIVSTYRKNTNLPTAVMNNRIKLLREAFYRQNPQLGAFHEAKTQWQKTNPYGRLYNIYHAGDLATAANASTLFKG